MAIQVQGATGTPLEVDASFKAARASIRPLDHGSLGHYSISLRSGIMAAALTANAEIFQFRWSDATRLCVPLKVTIDASVTTTFFAAGVPMQLDLLKATAWSAAGSGGTRATPAALLKRRTSMGSTLVAASDIGIASTAGLTAGTKTLETLAFGGITAACPITASLLGTIIAPRTPIYEASLSAHPLVLAASEGFVITSVAVPATGTWTFSVTVEWAEVASY